ncbi:hypothetical protein DINM_005381 [Dirofilaria immitis]|nr:hypothetical protein [Dirofilaria immitis]
MLETGSIEPPKEIVKNELSTLSNNITNCLSAVSLKVATDKETINCVEECVIAAEELQILGRLVRTDIKAVGDSVAAINEQIEQLERLFRNIDHLEEFVKQFKNIGLSDFIDIEGNNSEDDSPVEASSKMKCDMSVAGNISNLKSKKMKTKSRRKYKVVKLNESVYKSETKTSTFKVVPLSVMPQPSLNFRAQLLQKEPGIRGLQKWSRLVCDIKINGSPQQDQDVVEFVLYLTHKLLVIIKYKIHVKTHRI